MTVGFVLLALHVLGAMLWVGGMFFAVAVLRPGMSILEAPARLALHAQVFQRFFFIIWHVMPVMVLTGFAMEFAFYGGWRDTPWPVQVMSVTGLIMALLFVVIVRGPWPAMRRALEARDAARAGAAVQRIRVLVTANLVLGVVTAVVAVLEY